MHQIRFSPRSLRVIPKFAFPGPFDEMVPETFLTEDVAGAIESLKTYACIEVKNLGAKRTTIFEVGFVNDHGACIPWRDPDWMEPDRQFPMVLEPDSIGAAYLRIWPKSDRDFWPMVYVKTDCGEQFIATSPIMTDFFLHLKQTDQQAA